MEQLFMIRITLFTKDCYVKAFITYFGQTQTQSNKLKSEFYTLSENEELDYFEAYPMEKIL